MGRLESLADRQGSDIAVQSVLVVSRAVPRQLRAIVRPFCAGGCVVQRCSVSVQVWLTADAVQATWLVRSLPSACREQIILCEACLRPRLRRRCG